MWIVGALLSWLSRAPLGHDEARYALTTMDWLAGTPRWNYSPFGMTLLTAPALLAHGGELALRAAPLLWGLALVLVAVLVAGMTPLPRSEEWRDAVLAPPLETVVIAAKPWLPAEAAKRIRFR